MSELRRILLDFPDVRVNVRSQGWLFADWRLHEDLHFDDQRKSSLWLFLAQFARTRRRHIAAAYSSGLFRSLSLSLSPLSRLCGGEEHAPSDPHLIRSFGARYAVWLFFFFFFYSPYIRIFIHGFHMLRNARRDTFCPTLGLNLVVVYSLLSEKIHLFPSRNKQNCTHFSSPLETSFFFTIFIAKSSLTIFIRKVSLVDSGSFRFVRRRTGKMWTREWGRRRMEESVCQV